MGSGCTADRPENPRCLRPQGRHPESFSVKHASASFRDTQARHLQSRAPIHGFEGAVKLAICEHRASKQRSSPSCLRRRIRRPPASWDVEGASRTARQLGQSRSIAAREGPARVHTTVTRRFSLISANFIDVRSMAKSRLRSATRLPPPPSRTPVEICYKLNKTPRSGLSSLSSSQLCGAMFGWRCYLCGQRRAGN